MGGPVSRLPRPAGRTPAGRGYEKLSWTRGRAVRAFGAARRGWYWRRRAPSEGVSRVDAVLGGEVGAT
ncbi:hypothetical protein GCM10010342_77630 [Streptomyces anulatus]|nr:hypothetical protein GCM10010342_77630 [Streptomyces anulatus]